MVLVFLFGLLDIATAVILLLLKFFPVLKIPAMILGIAILAKSLRYIVYVDLASIIDVIAAGLIIAAALGYYSYFTYLIIIWLFQKGIRSFI